MNFFEEIFINYVIYEVKVVYIARIHRMPYARFPLRTAMKYCFRKVFYLIRQGLS